MVDDDDDVFVDVSALFANSHNRTGWPIFFRTIFGTDTSCSESKVVVVFFNGGQVG